MNRPGNRAGAAREASRFHAAAWPLLSGAGFELINDPAKVTGPYQKSQAMYRSTRSLFLLVGFDPADGNVASVSCGRRWAGESGWFALSNDYCALAKRFGFEELPREYRLGYGDDLSKAIAAIVEDLQQTLPVIVEQVALDDLVCIERERFGAQRVAESYFGPDYLRHVEISDFPQPEERSG